MEPVFEVSSRGTNLQQTFHSAAISVPDQSPPVDVDLSGVDWLHYKGKAE